MLPTAAAPANVRVHQGQLDALRVCGGGGQGVLGSAPLRSQRMGHAGTAGSDIGCEPLLPRRQLSSPVLHV